MFSSRIYRIYFFFFTQKPRKEKILLSRKPQQKVARYDSQLGVQCPDHNSTGQFVYPQDCKFFVNCFKGRAFLQPCSPGTHFNPDTLECDFPHKVKCYESESADIREPSNSESQVIRKSEKLQVRIFLYNILLYHYYESKLRYYFSRISNSAYLFK